MEFDQDVNDIQKHHHSFEGFEPDASLMPDVKTLSGWCQGDFGRVPSRRPSVARLPSGSRGRARPCVWPVVLGARQVVNTSANVTDTTVSPFPDRRLAFLAAWFGGSLFPPQDWPMDHTGGWGSV